MGYLPASDIATLKTFFASAPWSTMTPAQRFQAINAKAMIANPAPQGQVQKPYAVSDVLGVLSSTSVKGISVLPSLAAIRDDINSMNTPACKLWTQILAAGGLILATEQTAIDNILSATVPDPNWPAQVPQGPRPMDTVFGANKVWQINDAHGNFAASVDFVPLEDVELASQ